MSPSVVEFYEGKSVLVTGATGFIGKVLIEKLLRSCPGINKIYLLMRQKKGASAVERLRDLWNNKVFENLRECKPELFNKLKLIQGDLLEDELGISNDERQELKSHCNIIFHGAACVRFNLKLKDAVKMNLEGTQKVLQLAETMENLEAFIHISTAYSRCYLDVLEEKIYPPTHDPEKILDLMEWMDDATLSNLEPKLISSEPNTYAYTKAITENLVAKYSSKFPIGIGRLSIVTAAYKEPFPGWIDNLNGPTGLMIAGSKGVIRTMYCKSSNLAETYPVDLTVNGCILLSYITGLEKSKEIKVCNITNSGLNPVTWGFGLEKGRTLIKDYPSSICLWYPRGSMRSSKLLHNIDAFFSHLLPALFIDMILMLLGKKTFMMNVYRRIKGGFEVLEYYTQKNWIFKNDYFRTLSNKLTQEEREIFNTDITVVNWTEYLIAYIKGMREFCCKEDPSTIPQAKVLHKRLFYLDVTVKTIFVLLMVYFLYIYCFK